MKRSVLLIIFINLLLVQESKCQTESTDFDKLMWLVGTWVNDSNRDRVYESWSRIHDKELQGISYLISGQDTVVNETIRLITENEAMYYIPSVSNQNEGKPIRFVMTRLTDTEMQFENPEHDFPQVISCRKESEHTLLAEIWSTKEGDIRKIKFPMKRVSF
jgi:hypothetical protein